MGYSEGLRSVALAGSRPAEFCEQAASAALGEATGASAPAGQSLALNLDEQVSRDVKPVCKLLGEILADGASAVEDV